MECGGRGADSAGDPALARAERPAENGGRARAHGNRGSGSSHRARMPVGFGTKTAGEFGSSKSDGAMYTGDVGLGRSCGFGRF